MLSGLIASLRSLNKIAHPTPVAPVSWRYVLKPPIPQRCCLPSMPARNGGWPYGECRLGFVADIWGIEEFCCRAHGQICASPMTASERLLGPATYCFGQARYIGIVFQAMVRALKPEERCQSQTHSAPCYLTACALLDLQDATACRHCVKARSKHLATLPTCASLLPSSSRTCS